MDGIGRRAGQEQPVGRILAGRRSRRAFGWFAVQWALGAAILALGAASPGVHAQAHKGGGPRHAGQYHPPPPPPGGGRMTPEERRQLRRDIRDAGRDVYGRGNK